MIHLILCGGIGSRLWPLSRENKPKPFLKFGREHSLYQKTLLRLKDLNEHWVILPENLKALASTQAEEINFKGKVRYFIEPEARGTFAALSYPLNYVKDVNEPILVSSCDHLIRPQEQFISDIEKASVFAKDNKIVCFGIKPDKAHTGYGYIEMDSNGKILNFHEKPDNKTANQYLEKGFLWNSGIFMFTKAGLLNEIELLYPSLYLNAFQKTYELKEINEIYKKDYDTFEKISFDYAILEKTKNAYAVSASFEWSDLGSYQELAKIAGDKAHYEINSSNNFISSNKPVILSNIENLVIVEKEDCIFIANSNEEIDFKTIRKNIEPKLL